MVTSSNCLEILMIFGARRSVNICVKMFLKIIIIIIIIIYYLIHISNLIL